MDGNNSVTAETARQPSNTQRMASVGGRSASALAALSGRESAGDWAAAVGIVGQALLVC